jgi:phage-related baseplate assembly protein
MESLEIRKIAGNMKREDLLAIAYDLGPREKAAHQHGALRRRITLSKERFSVFESSLSYRQRAQSILVGLRQTDSFLHTSGEEAGGHGKYSDVAPKML